MLVKCAKINNVIVLFNSTEGHFQKNLCNKINITNVTLYFQLQKKKKTTEDIFKATIQVNIFIN